MFFHSDKTHHEIHQQTRNPKTPNNTFIFHTNPKKPFIYVLQTQKHFIFHTNPKNTFIHVLKTQKHFIFHTNPINTFIFHFGNRKQKTTITKETNNKTQNPTTTTTTTIIKPAAANSTTTTTIAKASSVKTNYNSMSHEVGKAKKGKGKTKNGSTTSV
jgi:hypothetical protein